MPIRHRSYSQVLSVILVCGVTVAAQSYFQPSVTFTAGKSSGAIVATDFNHDGKADVAVLDPTSAQIDVLLGDGKGNLGSPTTFDVGTNPTNLIAGDFNGDGFPEIGMPYLVIAILPQDDPPTNQQHFSPARKPPPSGHCKQLKRWVKILPAGRAHK
jgi:FG-GAP-like repeat